MVSGSYPSMTWPTKCWISRSVSPKATCKMRLGWSKPIDSSTLANGGSVSLQHIGKRL